VKILQIINRIKKIEIIIIIIIIIIINFKIDNQIVDGKTMIEGIHFNQKEEIIKDFLGEIGLHQ